MEFKGGMLNINTNDNNGLTRRSFMKAGALGAAAFLVQPSLGGLGNVFAQTRRNLIFRPYPSKEMPEINFVYVADQFEDPYKTSIAAGRDGIVVPDDVGDKKFSVNLRWYVEGFGYIWLAADNEGRYYTKGDGRAKPLNLNLEFARSRVSRNGRVLQKYEKTGTKFSPEVKHLASLSEELLADAAKREEGDGERSARLADRALLYALMAGERAELEQATSVIERNKRRDKVWFGCESRQMVWAKSEDFQKVYTELFNFSTITHYVWDSWYELFEPTEGYYNWGIKDDIVRWLSQYDITLEGRPLFWFHPTVTPDWLKRKNIDELKQYMEKHTRDLVTHYGDQVLQWEVFNEYHDWANIHNHTPEQITELTRLAFNKTREVNPKVVRILNDCCPWAEYAARGRMARMDATRPLRSPRKFIEDITNAGVDFDVLGIQIYFPQRDLSDIVRLLERLEVFGKPIYITEIGASSNLRTQSPSGAVTAPAEEPYAWHRHWDEELQADWLEQVYTLYYSRPSIKAINWYDFSDFRPFIANGGLVREDASKKQSFERMKELLERWGIRS